MEVILRVVLIVMVASTGMMMNHTIQSKAHTLHFLKEDLEIAVHDAALQTNRDEMRSGRIVFDQELAIDTLHRSFQKNSALSQNQYELKEIRFYDSSTTFPVTYQSTVSDFSDVFFSPTIVAILESSQNAYFSDTDTGKFMQIASYSYQVKKDSPQFNDYVIGAPNEQGFIWPVPFTRTVTSNFGMRTNPVTGVYKLHAGIDIAAPGVRNTPAVAARAGTVIYAGYVNGYGNVVVVDHGGGFETRYAHLNSISVSNGQAVGIGQALGAIGSTGNSTGDHLHYEIRMNGTPFDPLQFY